MNAMEMRRKEKSFTQEALAKRIGVAPSTYSQYASGARLIPLEKSKLIAAALECSVEEIFLPAKFTIRDLRAKNLKTIEK